MVQPFIQNKQYEIDFLKLAAANDFEPIETAFIETLVWDELSPDDLKQMKERSVWQADETLFALRNDFTDQLVRYYQHYQLSHQAVAYTGPIVRHHQVQTQLGLECYRPHIQEMYHAFETFQKFITQHLQDEIQYVVIGHYQLIDLLLEHQAEREQLLTWVEQRNISALKSELGISHPLVRLLLTPTHQQLELLNTLYPHDHVIIRSLNRWQTYFKSLHIDTIHLDITPQAPRSYYKETFIHAHLKDSGRTLSGGYYNGPLEGFGLGLTL
ncbi:ATP phosphoribosyltransferase regulatory subunit [Staphylococcus delphini]|uniref:ATP phosphoribosyltransferase regulatory subunit n=1 Tax=Staphylococcus delphini TaxID=53344 RepID=UPI000BBBCB23|nr:ATP phosphoribosyltransferase regulatory subunit [Staphylococcus delphini]PCF38937.1 ATP phosphoribosyltransferase regulatory subunit [Staphylococcus delphini]PCF51702.1 ATP phosphoribosyltransferase regulatory subunit [Staphylococcus delphini]PCF58052.1 ATP phosphoribosyltransferase regulatory subunit [Staphylococcus delphini]PCF60764.1 ATP phosphoribosyltransferase regulatory subunit [Staphylococcus delphini]